MRRLFLALWLALPVCAQSNHVVIISLDGCRPEFYLPGELSKNCETLTGLRDRGSYAKGAMPPYPSMTYPGHTTIATGVLPAKHGITGNTMFEPPKVDGRGFWYASDVKVPALWDVAHAAGLTVGSVSWPCNADSKSIDWNVPEFFKTPNDVETMRQHATPGLIPAIEKEAGAMTMEVYKDGAKWDAFLAACAAHILREHKPNLMYLHLIESDKQQHKGGRDSAELPAALRRLDGLVKSLVDVAPERTTFIVLGDHGFANVKQAIAPNWLLAKEGFITSNDWRAMVVNTGGSAGVYLKDAKDAESVHALLEKNSAGLYRIIEKEELVKLGGPRDAAFYLEAEPGYMFIGAQNGEALVRPAPLKGNHGYLPTNPQLHTGFIACGFGIKKGVVLDVIRLADVAPTVARLLGVKLDGADGRVLEEILASGG